MEPGLSGREEGGVFRFRAEVAVVGVEEGVEAEDGGELNIVTGKQIGRAHV